MIKDFYLQEITQGGQKWQSEVERERTRRREAEKMVDRMGEEIKRLQA